jgi:tetratricopeptide (TPR) repeat protein
MNLLQGIQLPELIMLILGFILGLALIFIFIYTALRGKPNLYLLIGFIVPALLIGYPSYKSSQFGTNVVKIEQLVDKVNENPTDIAAQKALIDNLEQLPASRCKTSPEAMTTIANAQASLGQYDSARVTIKKAVELDSKNVKAVESQKAIEEKWEARRDIRERVKHLDHHLHEIERRPNDKNLRDSIALEVRNVEKRSMSTAAPLHLENEQAITIGRANATLGRLEQSEQIADEVLKVSPNQKEAVSLKRDIENKKFKPQPKPQPKPQDKKDRNNDGPMVNTRMTVPAPAPVVQDTNLKLRFTPKGIREFKKWNIKE